MCTLMDGNAPPTITLATPNTNDIIPMIEDLSGGSIAILYADGGGVLLKHSRSAHSTSRHALEELALGNVR